MTSYYVATRRDDFDAINERLCEGEATEWTSVELHPRPINAMMDLRQQKVLINILDACWTRVHTPLVSALRSEEMSHSLARSLGLTFSCQAPEFFQGCC